MRTVSPLASKEFVGQTRPHTHNPLTIMNPRSALIRFMAILLAFTASSKVLAADALHWEQTNIEVQAEIGQEMVNVYYGFTNKSDAPVTITKTHAACGCTVPTLEKTTYAPGESGRLLATFDIGSRVGKQRKEISVEVQKGAEKESHKLELNVDIPQLIQLKSRALLWRIGDAVEAKDCEIVIHSTQPMAIEKVVSKTGEIVDSAFEFEIVEVKPKEHYLLKITPKDTSKKVRETIYLQSPDDSESHLRNYPIYAWIR